MWVVLYCGLCAYPPLLKAFTQLKGKKPHTMVAKSIQMINAAVHTALFETQLETIERFREFIASNNEVEQEFIGGLLNEFKSKIQAEHKPIKGGKAGGATVAKAPAAPRAPSAYTLFVKDKMAEIKAKSPEVKNGKELMKLAVAEWNTLTDDVRSKMKDALKSDGGLTGTQLLAKARAA